MGGEHWPSRDDWSHDLPLQGVPCQGCVACGEDPLMQKSIVVGSEVLQKLKTGEALDALRCFITQPVLSGPSRPKDFRRHRVRSASTSIVPLTNPVGHAGSGTICHFL